MFAKHTRNEVPISLNRRFISTLKGTNITSENKIFKCVLEKILKFKHNLRHAN